MQSACKDTIVCVGLPRTGTTSLTEALKQIGYNVSTDPFSFGRSLSFCGGSYTKKRAIDEVSNALIGEPFAAFFEQMYEKYPEFKYIYTYRDPTSWVVSIKKLLKINTNYEKFGILYKRLTDNPKEVNNKSAWFFIKLMCGMLEKDDETLLDYYLSHQNSVNEVFKDKPQQLLKMNITEGDGWKELLGFLYNDKPFPNVDHWRKD